MIFATDYFGNIKDELPRFNLKLLLNIEDLNNSIFEDVFNSLKPHQQEQYIAYKDSEEGKGYTKKRSTQLPYVDFNNLPEVFDDILLQKVMLYQKDGEVRGAIYDFLSEEHKGQIARVQWKIDREKFIKKIQSGKACNYIYEVNERNENTGLIAVWLYNNLIVLTWEECPEGQQFDESTYSKDKVHHFNNFEELDAFFEDNNILYGNFH